MPFYYVKDDYTYIISLVDEVREVNTEQELFTIASQRGFVRSDNSTSYLVFCDIPKLGKVLPETDKNIFLVNVAPRSKWSTKLTIWENPYNNQYLVNLVKKELVVGATVAKFLVNHFGGLYRPIVDSLSYLPKGLTQLDYLDLLEPVTSCDMKLVLTQIESLGPITELDKLTALDSHRAFNYFMVAGSRYMATLADFIWTNSKETGTTLIDLNIFIHWIAKCIYSRYKGGTTRLSHKDVLCFFPTTEQVSLLYQSLGYR